MNAASDGARYYQAMRQIERNAGRSPEAARVRKVMAEIVEKVKLEMQARYPKAARRSMTDDEAWAMDDWCEDRRRSLTEEAGIL